MTADKEEMRRQSLAGDSIGNLTQKLLDSEQFNATLTHLLVASYRLHSTLDYVELVSIIK